MKDKIKIIESLKSGKKDSVLHAIEKIKQSGDKEFLLHLATLMNSETDKEIFEAVFEVFCNLKDISSVPVVIDIINSDLHKEIRNHIVSSCWQSGLDYSNYLSVFVDVFVNNDLETAIEAMTVIEEMNLKLDLQIIERELDKLDCVKQNPEIAFLSSELKRILYGFSNIA